jgi:2-octaprenyl-6-methoxyphenol hydroxylase
MSENNNLIAGTPQAFDVIISGGGLSGALMALSLVPLRDENNQPLRIAIIEANAILTEATPSFDDRVLALSHGSAAYLKQVGAWQHLAKHAQAIQNIHISDRGHYGKARLYAQAHNVNALGYVAGMAAIGAALLKTLASQNNITWFSPDSIDNVCWQKQAVTVELASGSRLSAPLLLGCDGAQSVCRQAANIPTTTEDYQQWALIANVSTAKPHQNVAYERFTDTGPIAMLPLSAANSAANSTGRCSLVWTLTPELAKQMQALSDEEFTEKLTQAFGLWLGPVTKVGKRDVYPLKLVQAKEQVYHRVALMGNASHTIHPIAGQGFNLGLRDVVQMSKMIQDALKNKQDIGDFMLLNQYAQQRKQDHQQVIGLTDSLVTLFSNQLPPLVVGRNIGLKVLNYLTPLKKALVKKTMGY